MIKKVLERLQPAEHVASIHGHDPLAEECHLLMNLLVALSKKDLMPALVFNFNRGECECMGESLVKLLEGLEDKYRTDHPDIDGMSPALCTELALIAAAVSTSTSLFFQSMSACTYISGEAASLDFSSAQHSSINVQVEIYLRLSMSLDQ